MASRGRNSCAAAGLAEWQALMTSSPDSTGALACSGKNFSLRETSDDKMQALRQPEDL